MPNSHLWLLATILDHEDRAITGKQLCSQGLYFLATWHLGRARWLGIANSLGLEVMYVTSKPRWLRSRCGFFTLFPLSPAWCKWTCSLLKMAQEGRSMGLWIITLRKDCHQSTIFALGLPQWCSGWESARQCRGHGFEPWSGKIPHAAEQLAPWATITEPAHLEPVLHNKRGRDSERPAHRDEEWPPLATTRESPRTETKTQHSYK